MPLVRDAGGAIRPGAASSGAPRRGAHRRGDVGFPLALAVPVGLALIFTLAGCGGTGTGTSISAAGSGDAAGASSVSLASGEDGLDVGNDRPDVSYDGLMVRRRIVLALHTGPEVEPVAVRHAVDVAAAQQGLGVSDIGTTVLDAAFLERVVPEVIVAIAPGSSTKDADALVTRLAKNTRDPELAIDEYFVASVLVHDLRFTVATADPAALTAALSREGILADALSSYSTTTSDKSLSILYTGPLLGDDLVETVRAGIARAAATIPSAVSVAPRSTSGTGVDMALEPAIVAGVMADGDHGHEAGPAPSAAPASSSTLEWGRSLWVVGTAALVTVIVLLMTVGRSRTTAPARETRLAAREGRPAGRGSRRQWFRRPPAK